jgi:hypothetical protein
VTCSVFFMPATDAFSEPFVNGLEAILHIQNSRAPIWSCELIIQAGLQILISTKILASGVGWMVG